MRVGDQAADRIYYDDATQTEFTGTVTAIREVARVDGRQVWQLALDRTAFYPASGGQRCDTGVLTATARSGATLDVPITAVEEDDQGEVWHTSAKPLQEGTEVRGAVDMERRRDHTQQHSGQHLLSAVLLRECGAATVSFHMGEMVSTIDLDVAALTDAQLTAAAKSANDVIAAALPVAVRTVPADEARRLLAEGALRKLPPRDGPMRLVEIPGIDLNACGGTHVATTAAIGPLLLRGTERVRGGLRLSFVCGGRALMAAAEDARLLGDLGELLSVGPQDLCGSVVRLQAEAKAAAKERATLLISLAEMEARSLALQAVVIHTLDMTQPGRDAGYAKLLAGKLAVADGIAVALVVAPEAEKASVVLASKGGAVDCGTLLRTSLAGFEGRGGGSRELAQGALPAAALQAWLGTIEAEIRSAGV